MVYADPGFPIDPSRSSNFKSGSAPSNSYSQALDVIGSGDYADFMVPDRSFVSPPLRWLIAVDDSIGASSKFAQRLPHMQNSETAPLEALQSGSQMCFEIRPFLVRQ